jgi:hypothetical protein
MKRHSVRHPIGNWSLGGCGFLSLLAVLVAASAGADSHTALPKALMEAKAAYVHDKSWHTSVGDQFSDELKKWGRFKLVGDPKDADLTFRLTGSIEDRTTLEVLDAHTEEKLWSSKPDRVRKIVSELRKRVEQQGKRAPK